MGKVMLKGQ